MFHWIDFNEHHIWISYRTCTHVCMPLSFAKVQACHVLCNVSSHTSMSRYVIITNWKLFYTRTNKLRYAIQPTLIRIRVHIISLPRKYICITSTYQKVHLKLYTVILYKDRTNKTATIIKEQASKNKIIKDIQMYMLHLCQLMILQNNWFVCVCVCVCEILN